MTNDSSPVKGADLKLLRVTCKSVEAFIREMADLEKTVSFSSWYDMEKTMLVHSHERNLEVRHLSGT